jgi:hypothetical protein
MVARGDSWVLEDNSGRLEVTPDFGHRLIGIVFTPPSKVVVPDAVIQTLSQKASEVRFSGPGAMVLRFNETAPNIGKPIASAYGEEIHLDLAGGRWIQTVAFVSFQ